MSYIKKEDISKVLYDNGHSKYHPVLVDHLSELFENKIQQLIEEQEALDTAAPVDPLPMLYKLLNSAAANGDTVTIDVASKAIQRLIG